MRIPFLKNFRRGFATNSSSSHSFVYLKENGGLGDEQPSRYLDSEFGWNDFRLDTIREKLFYLLVSRIGGGWNEDSDGSAEFAEYGDQFEELSEEDFRSAVNGYVDHDSRGLIDGAIARDPHSVVFGGNDNDDGSQERIRAIRNREVDWTRTEIDYDDFQHIAADDEEGQAAIGRFLKDNPWAAR